MIQADVAQDVPAALKLIEAALGQGRHVAGWFGYELGYVLEPHLAGLEWPKRDLTAGKLWFGVFEVATGDGRQRGADDARRSALMRGRCTTSGTRPRTPSALPRVHDYIEAGDIYQANSVSFRSRSRLRGRSADAVSATARAGAQRRTARSSTTVRGRS